MKHAGDLKLKSMAGTRERKNAEHHPYAVVVNCHCTVAHLTTVGLWSISRVLLSLFKLEFV